MTPADPQPEQLAERLRLEAGALPFPPTPDLAGRERRRLSGEMVRRQPRIGGLARLALVGALLLAALVAVPEVRAAAVRLWQLGVVRVRVEPAPPTPVAATPAPPPTVPAPTPDLGLAGATTLAAASERFGYPLRLPAYPADLGPPDLVYLQQLDGAAVVLVWLDPADRSRPRMSLHALSSPAFVQKTLFGEATELLTETEVGGQRALWVRGPHFVQTGRTTDLGIEPRRIVAGDTLIWTVGELTYRLETELPLEEAIRVAESLR